MGGDSVAPAEVRLAVVREAIDAFNAGGFDDVLHLVDPDIEWYPTPTWPGPSVYRGYDGVRTLTAEFTKLFGDYEWKPLDLIPTTDGVVGHVCHAGSFGGRRIETAFGIQWVFRGRRVLRTTVFETWEQAVASAGIDLE